jgi:MoxR-like ATPase
LSLQCRDDAQWPFRAQIGLRHSPERFVPVTAKLSQQFYEKLGQDVANELVDWFNAVDATYRTDLRELNELNFARFDAKLEQRLAELKAELRVEIHSVRADLVKWMFAFWAPTALAVLGTGIGVITLLLRR